MKYVIGLCLFFFALFSTHVLAAENRVERMSIPVLIYHSISIPSGKVPDPKLYISPKQFEDQLATIIKLGYTPIHVGDLIQALDQKMALPPKPILLTFDDGYVDNYLNAFPILKKYKAHATIFVISHHIGAFPGFMTWTELREMGQSGVIDVESHTEHHVPLGQVRANIAEAELLHSKQRLEKELKKPIVAVAYPYGSHTEKTKEITRKTGYQLAFSTHPGNMKLQQNRFDLHRNFVKQTTNIEKLLNQR